MGFNYKDLEDKLEEACLLIHKDFLTKFNSDRGYVSPGGAKLEAFITDLQKEFENTTLTYLKELNLQNDSKAKSKALAVAKSSAKKCLDGFNKFER